MSHRKMHHWTCDTCGVEVAREGYGLPQGWTWTHPAGQPVLHACEKCTPEKEIEK